MKTTRINKSTDKTILTVGMEYKDQIITKIELVNNDIDIDYDCYGQQVFASYRESQWDVKGINLDIFKKGNKCDDFFVIIHGNNGLCEIANDHN